MSTEDKLRNLGDKVISKFNGKGEIIRFSPDRQYMLVRYETGCIRTHATYSPSLTLVVEDEES